MPKADGAEVLAAVQRSTRHRQFLTDTQTSTQQCVVNEGDRTLRHETGRGRASARNSPHFSKSLNKTMSPRNLQKTVGGIVRTLADILAMLNPAAFGQAIRLRRPVRVLAEAMGLPDAWEFEIAALLSKLGCVALPKELLERKDSGMEITAAERRRYREHPEVAAKLMAQIPRFEGVTAIIRRQDQAYTWLFELPFKSYLELSKGRCSSRPLTTF